MYKLLFFFCFFSWIILPVNLSAQTDERRPGELLIQLRGDADLPAVIHYVREQTGIEMQPGKDVAPDWRIYMLIFDESKFQPELLLESVRRFPGTQTAQWNHKAEDRTKEPNDTRWLQQSDMELIGASTAWDVSTGGLHFLGDTIVVAVLEKGVQRNHPDLAPNLWYNWREIPGNQLDDDQNGYVDDFKGWDPRTKTDGDGQTSNNHGTAVNGIVGAKGDNALGVTGVSWNVKLMTLTHIEYEDEIVAGYYYVAKQRRAYNLNKSKGAFVVATNASFGIDNGNPAQYPLWCAVYDSLGTLGVLNVGATANKSVDVDIQFDMPTACPSEFLITTTNVSVISDTKVQTAGYGRKSIDMGSPGDGSFTLNTGSQYGSFGGTSASAPHVTGAIGLLYSFSCENFVNDAFTQPAQCARRVRDLLLKNVSPNPTLTETTTGGRLDLARAADAVRALCDGTRGPLNITSIGINTQDRSMFEVVFETPDFGKYSLRVFNMLGQLVDEQSIQPPQFGIKSLSYDASYLPNGVYMMVLSRGQIYSAKKFTKF